MRRHTLAIKFSELPLLLQPFCKRWATLFMSLAEDSVTISIADSWLTRFRSCMLCTVDLVLMLWVIALRGLRSDLLHDVL